MSGKRENLVRKRCAFCGKVFQVTKHYADRKRHCNRICSSRNYDRSRKQKVQLSPLPGSRLVGISERDIRAKHDNMFKIRQGCKKLIKGRYLTDQQMREFCGVAPNLWRGHSEHPDFDGYKMKLQGVIYWGVPSSIRRMKEELNAI